MKHQLPFALALALAGSIQAQSLVVTLDESYGDSYKATATLTNDSSQAIDSWLGRIELGGTIRDLWRGLIEEDESVPTLFQYGVSNESYNGQLLPGESTTFGFIVEGDSGSSLPITGTVETNWAPSVSPMLRVEDITVVEGNESGAIAVFTISLSPAVEDASVTASYALEADTATEADDYTGTSGTATLLSNVTSTTVNVQIIGDDIEESTETFRLALSAPVNAGISRALATATIVDDDGDINSTDLLHVTVDDFPSGPHTDATWKALWPGTKWANGPDEGRLAVDDSISHDGHGKSIRTLYPQGGKQSGNSGAQWFADLNGEYEDLYMSYWVRFDEDFDFVLGGKLPGLGGAVSFEDRTHEWSGRLMWRENGKAEFYVHVPAGNNYDPGDRFWWNTEGFQATFIPGRWHHIELHMKMNTPGEFDGLMEGWFDGVKAASYPNFYFRDAPTQTASIAWVFFSTFFGGSSSSIWEAHKDEHAWFDEFIVSHSRIGYPGIPDDVDSDKLPNTWEITYFGNDSAASPLLDSDGDSSSNYDEFVAVTNPLDPNDRFRAQLVEPSGSNLTLRVDGRSGRKYSLEGCLDLANWTPRESIGPLTDDQPVTFSPPKNKLKEFYRVKVELP